MSEVPTGGQPRRLVRSKQDRWIAGVAGGLADYFNVDAGLVRLLFAALTIMGGGGAVVYVLAWLIMPEEGEEQSIAAGLFSKVNIPGSPSDGKEE